MATDWGTLYADAIARLPSVAARAPLTFCGNGACIDARISMQDIGPMLAAGLPAAAALAEVLQSRAARGQGGEIAFDWREGPAWITGHLPVAYAMGGTGPHAAWTLSAVGAPALLALEDRSDLMLRVAPPDVLLAEGERLVRAASVRSRSTAVRPPVFIFEYTAGRPVGGVVPTRSSRIIVRFGNFLLENDADFDRLTRVRAAQAGSGLISGFSSVAAADLKRETARVTALARAWRDAGLSTIHLELAGFETPALLRATLDSARGAMTSVGMSLSELQVVEADTTDLATAMRSFGERFAVDRVCVHADHWAASVTRGDPAVEMDALVTGCLLAGSRAVAGRPVLPERLDAAATFEPLPFESTRKVGPWTFVACASPYVRSPQTTLGLGDTFTGGCLLALGARQGGG